MSADSFDGDAVVDQAVRERLATVGAVLLDLDGTLIRPHGPTLEEAEVLRGARELLARLQARGVATVCFTSGTSFTPAGYAERLRGHGLPVRDEDMMTPASVAALRLAQVAPGARVLALGGAGLTGPLSDVGVELVAPADADTEADVVLIGYDHGLNAEKVEAACHAVWSGAALWTTTMARSYARSKGRRGVGLPGAVTTGIQYVTGSAVVNVGKPAPVAMEAVRELTGVAYEHTLVVGDDQDVEVAMGRAVGALTALVLTGTTGRLGPEALAAYPAEAQPDVVLDDVGALLELLPLS